MTFFAESPNMTPSQNVEELVTKTIRYRDVPEEYVPHKTFKEFPNARICDSVREYWRNKKDASLHDPAFHASSLLRLQGQDVKSNLTSPAGPKLQKQRGKLWSSHKSGIITVGGG